jgi:hypothetical protein
MVYGTYDIIGKYAVDYMGNQLPMRRSYTGKYSAHTGTHVWIKSTLTGAGETDAQIFAHIHSNTAWFNKQYAGRMVRIEQEMKYSYEMGMWYWTNTVHSA